MRAHLLHTPEPEHLALLRDRLDAAVVLSVGDGGGDARVLVAGRPSEADLEGREVLVIPYAGLPRRTARFLADRPGIRVYNLHHNAATVAECAIALFLAVAKHIVPMDRALRAHDWLPRYAPDPSVRVAGSTAIILGFGAIGQEVGRLARGLGMRVVGVRRSSGLPLVEVLPRADALFVAVPHTPLTDGMLGAAELALLPPTCVVVNVARAGVIDEEALYRALSEGRIHGAALDVWYRYPPDEASRARTAPANLPFEELDNVVMSPHRAGHERRTEELRMAHLATVLNALARGDEPDSRVDVAAGY